MTWKPFMLFSMRAKVTVDLEAPERPYWRNLGEATSQFLHALIGGDANLTFSANCGYWLTVGDWRGSLCAPFVNMFFGKGHCLSAWKNLV